MTYLLTISHKLFNQISQEHDDDFLKSCRKRVIADTKRDVRGASGKSYMLCILSVGIAHLADSVFQLGTRYGQRMKVRQ
jgi:hypothetical protein